ncbi:hypothetical protein NNO07_02980 [Pseudomonas resinovorans]|uniref:Uncharacterized protein n=1 Tax=Metapseudomonas resinovorans TaxID=53412 RepID=A0ABT4XZQ5_METRE|nr:hypothetical protein [Pseudomonas resinovorans]MDA8482021.1 hypothetical protein [Pseudomonas resinovorans]
MRRMQTALLSALLVFSASAAQAGVKVRVPYWVVGLECQGYDQCFAASNGTYTGSLNGARRFDDLNAANRFMNSLTSSIRAKSPQLLEQGEFVCLPQEQARGRIGPAC